MTERSGGVDRGGPGYVCTFRLPCAQYAITFLRRRFGVKAVGEKNPSPPTFHSAILPPPAGLKAETDNIRRSTISSVFRVGQARRCDSGTEFSRKTKWQNLLFIHLAAQNIRNTGVLPLSRYVVLTHFKSIETELTGHSDETAGRLATSMENVNCSQVQYCRFKNYQFNRFYLFIFKYVWSDDFGRKDFRRFYLVPIA